jgi:ATP-binding cassette, subfamily F, member 3
LTEAQPLVWGRDLLKQYGPQTVLEHATFVLRSGEKTALVGPNGAGKSTLFKLLVGELRPDYGELERKPGLRLGYLPQVPNVAPERLVREVLSELSAEAQALEREAAELEAWMADPDAFNQPDAQEKMDRYADLQTQLATARSQSNVTNDPILSDLGVYEELLEQKFGDLSGGEKSKVLLARALANAKQKDLLLFDEPTNHMDIDTIEWIEEYLMSINATVLLSSHDKFLLDNVAHKCLEVDKRRVYEYEGNYTEYRIQRDAIARAVEAKKRRNFDEVQRQLAIIEDLKGRNRYRQIQERRKGIARVEAQTAALDAPTASASKAFRLQFQAAAKSGRSVLRVEGVRKAHGGRLLFDDVTFELEKADKVGLIGPNGSGKTTLLEVLVGRQEPDAGVVDVSQTTKVGYFAQHHATMDFTRTVYDEFRSISDPPPKEEVARALLGRFGFGGDLVWKKVGELSGGERARLALAKFIAQEQNFLVLDEPTNHLDIESQEIVAAALKEYPGSVLVVSHNRSFLSEIVNKVAVIAHRKVGVFQGTFADSWTAAKLGEFMDLKNKPKYRVLKVVRDWEKGTSYQKGETIQVTGAETQAFRRLLRWAEGEGRIERA